MLRLRGSIFLSIAVAAALAPAASAPAATTAQRFADAVERGKSAIRAKGPEFRAAFDAVDYERCERALESTKKPPSDRELEHFVAILVVASLQPLIDPSRPVLQQIVADLETIPTRDPILRSGRAAWREIVQSFDAIPRIDRPCEQLERWARSGWRASARPAFDVAAFERIVDGEATDRNERKLARAARRLRQLGVSKADAYRFKGETLFDDIPDEITGVATDEDEPRF